MTMEIKKRVIQPICEIVDRDTTVTANNDFETISLLLNGESSEIYDYEGLITLHSLGEIRMKLENLTSYDESWMKGSGSTASADDTTSAYIPVCNVTSASEPSIIRFKITGSIGNKRHVQLFQGVSGDVIIGSYFTTNTASELTSMQLYSPVNDDLNYTCFIYAKPKLEYNHEAIRIAREVWYDESDTRTVSGFSGEDYDVVVDTQLDLSETDFIDIQVNGIATATRTEQKMQNAGGTLSASNSTQSIDARLHTGQTHINKEIGRKSIAVTTNSNTSSPQQVEQTTWESDTVTEFTSLDLVPSGTITGSGAGYAEFDGSSWIDFGNPPELQITDNLIVEVGVRSYTTPVGQDYLTFASYREGAGLDGWQFHLGGVTQPVVGGLTLTATSTGIYGAGTYTYIYTNSAISNGETGRVEFISSSSSLFEIEGIPVATTETATPISSIWTGGSKLRLGARGNGVTETDFLHGQIDYMRIYDGATLVLDFNPQLYGDLLDHSAYAHSATNNGVTFVQTGTSQNHTDVYLVPKNFNDTIIPFRHRQRVNINGDFSAGHSFDIPEWASFMRVRFIGENSSLVNILAKLNGLSNNTNYQTLRASVTSTSASTGSEALGVAVLRGVSNSFSKSEMIINLSQGYNRPLIQSQSYNESRMEFRYESIQDSVSVFTHVDIESLNANPITGVLIADFI